MTIDYEKISKVFKGKAWAYAEQYNGVKIGKWGASGVGTDKFSFYEPLEPEYLFVLRVFNEERELKFTGDKCRDTAVYNKSNFINGLKDDFIEKLADVKYYLYGEQRKENGAYTELWEDRGGKLYFPAELKFPDGKVSLMLGIKNFARYNNVPVLPKDEKFDYGLSPSGAGALEVIDYAYTGFYYQNGKRVEL